MYNDYDGDDIILGCVGFFLAILLIIVLFLGIPWMVVNQMGPPVEPVQEIIFVPTEAQVVGDTDAMEAVILLE
jgi:hypothetical protein